MPLILQRPPGTSFEYRYTFPPELDLSEYSTNDNKKFSLEMIIAYAGFHSSVFQNEETWYYIKVGVGGSHFRKTSFFHLF